MFRQEIVVQVCHPARRFGLLIDVPMAAECALMHVREKDAAAETIDAEVEEVAVLRIDSRMSRERALELAVPRFEASVSVENESSVLALGLQNERIPRLLKTVNFAGMELHGCRRRRAFERPQRRDDAASLLPFDELHLLERRATAARDIAEGDENFAPGLFLERETRRANVRVRVRRDAVRDLDLMQHAGTVERMHPHVRPLERHVRPVSQVRALEIRGQGARDGDRRVTHLGPHGLEAPDVVKTPRVEALDVELALDPFVLGPKKRLGRAQLIDHRLQYSTIWD